MFWNRYKYNHQFSNWKVTHTFKSTYGDVKIIQARICEKCGYTDIKSEEV